MRKRFITQTAHEPGVDTPNSPLIAPDEITHRYSSHALADIRSAIAEAQAAVADKANEPLPDAARSWAPELPPMAATESPGLSEVTQRYADRSVAGIRAAIAAAREAEALTGTARAAARLALDESPQFKVPSMVLAPREATPEKGSSDAVDGDDEGGSR